MPAVQIGLVGSGNMARALALGWGEPVLCTDSGSGRAQELAALVGGQAVGSNRELAERADLVVLAHKPAQLAAVAQEMAGSAKVVVSILARTMQAEVRAAYPETPVFRIEPNTPVEVREGVISFAIPDADVDAEVHATVPTRPNSSRTDACTSASTSASGIAKEITPSRTSTGVLGSIRKTGVSG